MSSAQQAKERLLWCVSQRRNGGAWVETGREIIITCTVDLVSGKFQARQIDGLPNRYRWRYA